MTNPRLIPVGCALLLALAACGEAAARREAKTLARRNSCVAAELAVDAKVKLASLDTLLANAQGTPMEPVTAASRAFAAAYRGWADASSQAADWADSAAWARSRADSLRYAQQAERASPRVPAAGTVEANAAGSWREDVHRALDNPDHPCNQPQAKD